MENIKYHSPAELKEKGEDPQHKFDLIIDGEQIGGAEIQYLSKPLPHYVLKELWVDFEHKGKGYASQIMDQVETFLKERKKPGLLVEAILEGDPAQGMYAKRGWQEVPNSLGIHVYNWPENIDFSILIGYDSRYTHPMDRSSWVESKED